MSSGTQTSLLYLLKVDRFWKDCMHCVYVVERVSLTSELCVILTRTIIHFDQASMDQ